MYLFICIYTRAQAQLTIHSGLKITSIFTTHLPNTDNFDGQKLSSLCQGRRIICTFLYHKHFFYI